MHVLHLLNLFLCFLQVSSSIPRRTLTYAKDMSVTIPALASMAEQSRYYLGDLLQFRPGRNPLGSRGDCTAIRGLEPALADTPMHPGPKHFIHICEDYIERPGLRGTPVPSAPAQRKPCNALQPLVREKLSTTLPLRLRLRRRVRSEPS